MEQTVIQKAIEKIDEQIEIAQACRIEAAKIKDETSMERHHGMKIALVFMRQELVNLLEMEKQQIKNAVISTFKAVDGYCFGMTAEEYYKEYFKSE